MSAALFVGSVLGRPLAPPRPAAPALRREGTEETGGDGRRDGRRPPPILGAPRMPPALGLRPLRARGGGTGADVTAGRRALRRILEFGVPPAIFLAVVVRVVLDPASPATLVTFMIGAAAALASESVTFPMDALKAGVQLNSGGARKREGIGWLEYTGLLYYGLRAALMRTIPYTGMRMTLYTVLKGTGAGLEESPVVLAAMAAVAGVISQLLLSPIDLFKVRMQADAATVRSLRPSPSPAAIFPRQYHFAARNRKSSTRTAPAADLSPMNPGEEANPCTSRYPS